MKKNGLLTLLSILLVFAAAESAVSQVKTAKVTGGEVQGVFTGDVASFKGIPFAAPPVGELRWKAPQPVKAWTGVKTADAFAPGCIQDSGLATMIGAPTNFSEDCLYLNVWTAAKSTRDRLPVMVWIYGGGFAVGATNTPVYDGTKFAQKGVVLVSVAYRVGPFGFLAHPDLTRESGKGSGTYGLQDMIAGLLWVKNNIAQFGGDPSRVTIFGESAGGIAVSMLAASPAAKGLFHRVISESGGSFAPARVGAEAGQNVPTLPFAESTGKKFLDGLGASDLKTARALSADQIQKSLGGLSSMGRFWPTADGDVLPADQYEAYQAGRFNDTPVLIGTNSDEGALFARGGVTPAAFEQQIRAGYGPQADTILKAYPHSTDAEAFKSTKDIFRESAFAWHTWAWARLQSQKGKNKAYVYYFDHRTPATPDGSNHASEIPFVFRNLDVNAGVLSVQRQPGDAALSDLMSSYWVNFARTGDPNGAGLPAWPAFTESEQKAMFFDPTPSARPVPNLDKLKAFDAYYAWRREQVKEKAKGSN
ncbi:MAG TPA: carboxylesterase family protein [Blastocatellia bacterium]|nr:carboxylesterase family protein [Blastocatellia bacterium]